jgi:hypothetical protein
MVVAPEAPLGQARIGKHLEEQTGEPALGGRRREGVDIMGRIRAAHEPGAVGERRKRRSAGRGDRRRFDRRPPGRPGQGSLEESRLPLGHEAVDRRRLLTFVVVGGGPTGVEMAGALAEIARRSLVSDFRRRRVPVDGMLADAPRAALTVLQKFDKVR